MLLHKDTVILPKDIVARNAANFVHQMNQFDCDVWLHKDQCTVNAKSLVGVLHLRLMRGQEITVTTSGTESEHKEVVYTLLK